MKTNLNQFLRDLPKRLYALVLSICMVVTMFPITSVRAVNRENTEVLSFAVLDSAIQEQSVTKGTPLEEITLPNTLEATVFLVSDTQDNEPPKQVEENGMPMTGSSTDTNSRDVGEEKVVTIENITWESNVPYDSESVNTYLFTPVLPSGYTLKENTALPDITVMVAQGEQTATENVIAMIDTLPSMDEWMAMDETNARNMMDNIVMAKRAYDELSAEEKQGIDETKTAKLLELGEMASQLANTTTMAATEFGTNCTWEITAEGVLILAPKDATGGTLPAFDSPSGQPWNAQKANIKAVKVQNGVKANAKSDNLFYGLSNCTTMDLSGLDTTNVTSMGYMFFGCTILISLDLSNFNTSQVKNMSGMFFGCSGLTSLDVSSFNTAEVTTMSEMFRGCSDLTSLDVSKFDTTEVRYMGSMFNGCSGLTSLDVSKFDTSKVTTMSNMFNGCSGLTSLDVSKFDTTKVTSMGNMFNGCSDLALLNLSNFNTANVTNMSSMFDGCKKLTPLDVSSFNTAKVTTMSGMFKGCSSLSALDVSGFNTSSVKYMGSMFSNCTGLLSLTLGDSFTTAEVTDMSSMFASCRGLTSLDVSDFNTTKVTNMMSMFSGCSGLTSLDLSNFNFANVTNMSSMLSSCNIGLNTNYYKKSMSGAKLYLYDKHNKADIIAGNTDLAGNETNIIFMPYAITKSVTNGSFTTKSSFNATDYQNYFTKTEGFYSSGTAPTYDSKKDYAQQGETVTITLTPDSGGWLDSFSVTQGSTTIPTASVGDNKYTFTMPAGDVTITATFELPVYPVTIDVNKDNTTWSDHGKTFKLSKDSGSTFVSDLTKVVDGTYAVYEESLNTGVTVTVSGAATSATLDYYTVTFYDGVEDYTTPAPQFVLKNVGRVNEPNGPSKTGYTFSGWKTTNEGSTAFDFVNTAITESTKLYASWTPNTYDVTLNGNGGSGSSLTSYTYGVGASLPNWTRTNYVFKGWYDNSSFIGDPIITIPNTEIGNKTYYAKWADETAPTISVDTPPTAWQASNVDLSVSFADQIGVSKLYVKIDDGAYSEITNFGTSPYLYAASKEGEHTYQFKAEDAAGNTTESNAVIVKLDTTAPSTVNITYETMYTNLISQCLRAITFGNFFNEEVNVNIEVIDAVGGSGVNGATVEYQLVSTTSDESEPTTGWQSATLDANGKFDFTVDTEFQGLVWVRGYDLVGNYTTNHNDLTFEINPPSVNEPTTVPDETKWYGDDVSFTFEANDGSGIQSVTVSDSITNGSTVSDHGDGTYTVTVSGNGEHMVQAIIADKAGNITLLPTDGYVVKIDKTIPTIDNVSGNLTGDDWTNDDIELTVTPSVSGGSGQTITVIDPEGNNIVDDSGKFIAKTNGNYIVTITTGAGKTATKTIVVDRIDRTKPANSTVTLNPATPNGANDWYRDLTITITPPEADGGAPITSYYKLWKTGQNEPIDYTELGEDGVPSIADGEYTLKVQSKDAAGNVSTDSIHTFKLDTGVPDFTNAPALKAFSDTEATITFVSNEAGKVYWMIDPSTVPSANDIKNNGESQSIAEREEKELSLSGLSSGEQHIIYLVLEDSAGNLTAVNNVEFYTRQMAPSVSLDDLYVDYYNENITLPNGLEAYLDLNDPDGSILTPSSDNKITITPGESFYLRYPSKTEDGETIPASAGTSILLPARPTTPSGKTLKQSDITVSVQNKVSGEEYVIQEKGTTPDWSLANTTGEFQGLTPNKEYRVYTRIAAVENASFASLPSETDVTTLVTIGTVTINGDGASKEHNTVTKPAKPNPGGITVTYKGEYNKDYIPSIVIGANTYEVELTWNSITGKGTWTYDYNVSSSDTTLNAEVVFQPRTLNSITTKNVTLFADHEANKSITALQTWLYQNQKVDALYNNKVSEAKTAVYTTTDSFDALGKTYAYTATLDTKTAAMDLYVKPVTVKVNVPSDITKVKNTANGFTQAQLGLPTQIDVSYTGDGYTTKTSKVNVSWDDAFLSADFGKTATEKTFTGTMSIPTWATIPSGINTTIKVKIVDQRPLTNEQMSITLPDWTYGDKAMPNPSGNVVPNDTNGNFKYSYSNDGGNTWMSVNQLSKSTGGNLKAGTYSVKMEYVGDYYIGTKTTTFHVFPKELVISTGTLEAKRKVYDGSATAILNGTPVITGIASKDLINVKNYSGKFTSANVGDDILVKVNGFTLEGTDKDNYKLPAGASLELTSSITKASGTSNPDYVASLEQLAKVHIVTNVTPTLGSVTLPAGWSFTTSTTKPLIASNDNLGKQNFNVRYTSNNANYADVNLTYFFPVSTIKVSIGDEKAVHIIPNVGDSEALTPIAIHVIGAALPTTGEYSQSNMVWYNSCDNIVDVTGEELTSAEVTAKAKGISMVGISYPNTEPFGYVLIKVDDSDRPSDNQVEQIVGIGDTLAQIVDTENPSDADVKAVNTIANEITKLPDTVKKTLTVQDVESIDALKNTVNRDLNIQVIKDPKGSPPQPKKVSVIGTAIASGVEEGDVKIYVTPVDPTGTDTKMEFKLEMDVDGTKEVLKAPLFFTMTLPNDVDVSKLKIKHIMENGIEEVSFTSSGQTITFKLDSFSGLQLIVGEEENTNPDAEYEFWQSVKDSITNAQPGDTISIHTKEYDKMPWYVMDALRENPEVTFVITWNGGDTITIPAGQAQPKDDVRVYWTLSALKEVYSSGVTDPSIPDDPSKDQPSTDGTITEITAPNNNKSAGSTALKNTGKAYSESQAEKIKATDGKDMSIPREDGQLDANGQPLSPDVKQQEKTFCLFDILSGGRTKFNCGWCSLLVVLTIAMILSGIMMKLKCKLKT